jgi:CheY-like chemotaxis protein
MSGLELAESLKSKLGTKMPPIIAISADNSAEYAKGEDSIFSDFLLKTD